MVRQIDAAKRSKYSMRVSYYRCRNHGAAALCDEVEDHQPEIRDGTSLIAQHLSWHAITHPELDHRRKLLAGTSDSGEASSEWI